MSKSIILSEYDVIFISYDEPNAELNWSTLLNFVPWAQRVHGVKGSDAAHKTAANLSSTDRFITIDGDNLVFDEFFNQTIEVPDEVDLAHSVLSWPSINEINGQLYSNGGIKCWPKEVVLNMRTHELADPQNKKAQIDFCWDINYILFDRPYSKTVNNASPQQAWRAGFREGVKLSLNNGYRVNNLQEIYSGNLDRLRIWMTVGLDKENGIWAILGSRMGCRMTHFSDWDFTKVRDFDYLNELWKDFENLTETEIFREIEDLGNIISYQLFITSPFQPAHSAYFKTFPLNPCRQSKQIISKAS